MCHSVIPSSHPILHPLPDTLVPGDPIAAGHPAAVVDPARRLPQPGRLVERPERPVVGPEHRVRDLGGHPADNNEK